MVFKSVSHDTFQQIELFMSSVSSRINMKQRAAHASKWEKLSAATNTQQIPNVTQPRMEKLVVNLSDVELTNTHKSVLSKGLNFAIIPSKVRISDFLKAIETSTVHLSPETITEFKIQLNLELKNIELENAI
jgi:hypothetical protein